jgi:hypothetical protein
MLDCEEKQRVVLSSGPDIVILEPMIGSVPKLEWLIPVVYSFRF